MEDARRCNAIEWDLNKMCNVVCIDDKFAVSDLVIKF